MGLGEGSETLIVKLIVAASKSHQHGFGVINSLKFCMYDADRNHKLKQPVLTMRPVSASEGRFCISCYFFSPMIMLHAQWLQRIQQVSSTGIR